MRSLIPILFAALLAPKVSWAEEVLTPYQGPSAEGVDRTSLSGKLMCGYQGWFNCEGDGAALGWIHWGRDRNRPPGPGNVAVDLWPDLSEYGPDERFPTAFRHADGRVAEAFSSHRRETVVRHFRWMEDYGIDGVFVQRFANELRSEHLRHHRDVVLAHCREGAHRHGRAYAVMYDLSGLRGGQVSRVLDDWRTLAATMQPTRDRAYLHHRGKPLVAVWGIGFNDGRRYTLRECAELVAGLKGAGCSVMLGVPSGWRSLDRDAVRDPALLELVGMADVLSPWNVGRYRRDRELAGHVQTIWKPDAEWCRAREIDYLPTVFPGFSWANLHGGRLDEIPRRKGEFLWEQFRAVRETGASMVYVAMFDEVDEGTAVFKCTNDPPAGEGARFVTLEGLPSDYYLQLCGHGGRLLRGELAADTPRPEASRPEGKR